jgi:hypothetical protein
MLRYVGRVLAQAAPSTTEQTHAVQLNARQVRIERCTIRGEPVSRLQDQSPRVPRQRKRAVRSISPIQPSVAPHDVPFTIWDMAPKSRSLISARYPTGTYSKGLDADAQPCCDARAHAPPRVQGILWTLALWTLRSPSWPACPSQPLPLSALCQSATGYGRRKGIARYDPSAPICAYTTRGATPRPHRKRESRGHAPTTPPWARRIRAGAQSTIV